MSLPRLRTSAPSGLTVRGSTLPFLLAVILPAAAAVAQSNNPYGVPTNPQDTTPQQPVTPNGKPQNQPGPAPRPPAYPIAKPESIDPAVRAKARKIIEDCFTDESSSLRANALEAAQKHLGDDARGFVVKGLSDTSAPVRFAACIAAGDLHLSDLKPIVYRLAYDGDPNVRLAARYGLHKLGDSTLSQEMVNPGLLDDRKGVRANAVMLLGMLGEKSAIKPLSKLKERESVVGLQISEALWRLGDHDALDHLIAATISMNPGEQIIALLALGESHDMSVLDHIRGLMISEYPEVTLAAARAAGMMGVDEGYGLAVKYSKSSEPRQRALAALAFGAIGRSDSQARLKAAMEDQDVNVRLAAAAAALELKGNK